MIYAGTVVGMHTGERGGQRLLILHVQFTSPEDIQYVEVRGAPGDDFKPAIGARVLCAALGPSKKQALAVDDMMPPEESFKNGERRIYASLNGTRVSMVYCKTDGSVVLNNGADFAVAFNRLQTKLFELEGALRAHTHGGGATPTWPTALDLDISDAKSETVYIP